jgi:hypothetical protein
MAQPLPSGIPPVYSGSGGGGGGEGKEATTPHATELVTASQFFPGSPLSVREVSPMLCLSHFVGGTGTQACAHPYRRSLNPKALDPKP